MYFRRYPPFITRKLKLKIITAICICAISYTAIMAVLYLRQISMSMAVSDAIDIVVLDINSAVSERMRSADMSYERFVSLEKDDGGFVTAIKTNMSEINALSADILSDIVGKGERRVLEVDIPLGNLMGSSLMMGKGPDVPLEIIMLTSSRADLRNDLESAGINQTKHRIVLELKVEIDVLIPWDMVTTVVYSDILVAETVIVGGVPQTYISME